MSGMGDVEWCVRPDDSDPSMLVVSATNGEVFAMFPVSRYFISLGHPDVVDDVVRDAITSMSAYFRA